jgi:ADP-heptose:LPS heptosyltransferase
MNVNFQRNVDRIAGTLICQVLSLFLKKRQKQWGKANPRKILIILLSEMGALVLANPMFDHIKKKFPNASLFALVFEKNKEVLDLLKVIPEYNILTVRDSSMKHLFEDSVHVVRTMRKIGIDTVIDCELFSRISSIYSFLSGASIRVGFHPHTQEGLYRGDFINRPVLYNPYQHISFQFINLVEAIESTDVPTVKRTFVDELPNLPQMEVHQDEIKSISRRLINYFPQVREKRFVLIYPGGGLLSIRAWPLPYFCEIAEDLIGHRYSVGIVGMQEDKEIAGKILTYCDSQDCIDLTGHTRTVRELMLLFHMASLLITNDGGPAHFASMTPIPIITLYGPETPTLYGPLSDKAFNFFIQLSCAPCLTAYNHRNSPCDGNNICLQSIDPREVLKKSYEILNNKKQVQD